MSEQSGPPRVGWQPHPDHPGRVGYFNGVAWSAVVLDEPPADNAPPQLPSRHQPAADQLPATSPYAVLAAGLVVSVVGVLLVVVGAAEGLGVLLALGYLVSALGGLVASVGTAAVGALIALRYHDSRR
jgi:hypothetical protein